MIFPTVHMNGTSREALVEGYLAAHRAIVDAIKAMGECYPNGRDYYTQGPDALKIAMDEFDARRAALGKVASDLMELAEHCQDS